jgi:hypothetical protein
MDGVLTTKEAPSSQSQAGSLEASGVSAQEQEKANTEKAEITKCWDSQPEDEGNEGDEGTDDLVDDMANLRAERGISLLEEISRAMLLEEQGGLEGRADPSADDLVDRRKATTFNAKELEELIRRRATPDSKKNHIRRAHRSWQQLDSLLETRASKVSRETLKDSDIMVWAGTVSIPKTRD